MNQSGSVDHQNRHLHTLALILITTIATFGTLYLPQPILPELADQFLVSASDAALLVSVTMLPMAVAPIVYGYLLESVPARRILVWSVAIIAICQFLFVWSTTYLGALTSRLLLGLALPAAFTALMTFCATSVSRDKVKRIMGLYIATSIVGGFSGRFISGLTTATIGSRWAFLILGGVLVINWLLLFRLDRNTQTNFAKPNPGVILGVIQQPVFLYRYLTIFFVFFVFAGVLNNLPFQLKEIDPELSTTLVGFIYIGYLVGVLSAIMSDRLVIVLGGERKALIIGLVVLFVSLCIFYSPDYNLLLANVFLLSFGMFTCHAVLSSSVNYLATQNISVTNGLYLAIYYAGGSLGSWLPSVMYGEVGWPALLGILMFTVLAAAYCTIRATRDSRW